MKIKYFLALFSFCAIFYFTSEWFKQSKKKVVPEVTKAQPDFIATGLKIKLFNAQGRLQAELKSAEMTYYSEHSQANFIDSEYSLYNKQETVDWTIKANLSQLTKRELLNLSAGVTISSDKKDLWLNQFNTDNINLNLNKKTIDSHSLTLATGPKLSISASALSGNLDTQEFELQNNVKTTIKP